jgi:transcriptional regulator with XRE-family HTH domain
MDKINPVKELRMKRCLSQKKAAEDLKWTQAYLCQVEKNRVVLSPQKAMRLEEWSGGKLRWAVMVKYSIDNLDKITQHDDPSQKQ